MIDFETARTEYEQSLTEFVGRYELPETWFSQIDHVAIKCADAADYEATVQQWLPQSQELSYVSLDYRRLASARLSGGVALGRFGHAQWLEIMEPRPEKLGADTVGIDHVEFYFRDFTEVQKELIEKGIKYTPQSNINHDWLSIVINDQGQELKINNRTLANIVAEEASTGISTSILPQV